MKRFALFMAAAIAAFSCTSEIDWEPLPAPEMAPASSRVVHFRAVQTDTKAQFGALEDGAYPTLWTNNDTEVKLSLNYGSAVAASVNASSDHRTASFDATIDFSGVDGPYTFYSVSPSSAASALSPSREAWKVSIPCVQTPSETSVDEAGIILAAKSIAYSEALDVNVVDMYFDHLTAYGRMSLANLALSQGETVSAVELTVTTPIVGDWYWKCSDGQLTDYGASSTLTINTTRTSDIWFACAPVDVSEEMMNVTVYTNKGYFEQLVEFPANRSFEAGRSAVFTVNMSGAGYTEFSTGGGTPTGDFTLVTDASTLAAGDEVLIVYTAGSVALGAISSNSSYRTSVDVSISNGAISSEGSATILTLVAGSSSGTWAFKDGNNYLTSPSSGTSNNLLNSSSVTDNSSWSVAIDGSGLATIHAQSGMRTYILYNPSQPRFTCYDSADKSGMKKVSFYRRSAGGSGAASTDPMLEVSDYGCYLGSSSLTWAFNAGAEQVTRSYDANGVQTYTLIDPSDVEELEIVGYKKSYVKGDSFTVSVHWRKGISTVHSESYNVTLIKEVGPKVWLSDGAGKGFIIKK